MTLSSFGAVYETATAAPVNRPRAVRRRLISPISLISLISPNGDGINDVFTVAISREAQIVGMEGTIYDRWGSVVFSSTDNPFTWNGARGSESLNPGVYVYLVKVAHLSQGALREEVLTGDVTLLR